MRHEDLIDTASILDVLERLDPMDQVGAEVVRDLLQGRQVEIDDG
jgi:hypothetical protein